LTPRALPAGHLDERLLLVLGREAVLLPETLGELPRGRRREGHDLVGEVN
jgi:hypothetical protein